MKTQGDKFAGERLNSLADNLPDACELEPSAELEFRAHSIATVDNSPPRRNKKKQLFAYLAPLTSVALCAVLLCSFFIPHRSLPINTEPLFYSDSDLVSHTLSYDEMIDNFDFLIPIYENAKTIIKTYNYKKNNKPIYATIKINAPYEYISLNVVFVNNYNIIGYARYENLTDKAATDIFEYEYKILDDNDLSFAKFEYDGYRYFIEYSNEFPDEITSLMEKFEMI